MAGKTRVRVYVGVSLGITLVAIFAAFFWFRVCDEQVTADGKIVDVCRHLATTDPPVIVLGVLALVLLSTFYVEISGFGFTLKSRITDLEQRTEHTEETVDDLAEFNRERLAGTRVNEVTAERVPDPRIANLASRYNTLRWTMPSGNRRTRLMSEVVNQIQEALRDATDFDVTDHLTHDDGGVRLAAYAYLRKHALPDVTSALVNAAAGEDKPFGQYNALSAVLHQVATGGRLTERDRLTLRDMLTRVGHTDRGQLIRQLLGEG